MSIVSSHGRSYGPDDCSSRMRRSSALASAVLLLTAMPWATSARYVVLPSTATIIFPSPVNGARRNYAKTPLPAAALSGRPSRRSIQAAAEEDLTTFGVGAFHLPSSALVSSSAVAASSASPSPAADAAHLRLSTDFPVDLSVQDAPVTPTHGGADARIDRAPVHMQLHAPPGTAVFFNLRDYFSLPKGAVAFDPSAAAGNLSTIPGYLFIAPTRWQTIPMVPGQDPVLDMSGLMTANAQWEMLSYPLGDLLFTFAAVPTDAAGKLQPACTKYASMFLHLQSSDASDCRLMQNIMRNIQGSAPSCEELKNSGALSP